MATCFDLWECIDSALRESRVQAQVKGLVLECKSNPGVPRSLRGDPQRVRQILTNLVSNAVNFTPRGKIDISVDVADDRESGTLIRIAVSDTGVGMSEAQRSRLFDRGETTTAAGLGLAVSRRLAAKIGGTLGAASQLGKGSTVWFTFRCEQSRSRVASDVDSVPPGLPAASPAAAGLPVIDAEQQLRFAAGDPQLAEELLDMLLSELPVRQEKIARALAAEDVDTLAAQAHKLAGGTAYCGVPALKQACDKLREVAACNADVGVIRRQVENLNAEIARLLALVPSLPRSRPPDAR
jgi:HPt (histidine-containing phosphotransfer) domain-containing protein